MSKGSIFWGKSRGKLGEMVLAVVKGQQTQRAYNGTPANPRTELQQVQRIKFAAAVKFYKSSVQNMFKMAFEGKKQTESDYNAFMRINLKEGIAIYPTKEEVDDPFFPMVAPWRVSQGSLNTLGIDHINYEPEDNIYTISNINIPTLNTDYSWDNFLSYNPQFQVGDIITAAMMVQEVSLTGTSIITKQSVPAWKINSIVVGADLRGGTLQSYFAANDFGEDSGLMMHMSAPSTLGFDDAIPAENLAIGGVFIHSRPRSGGLKVSSEYIHLNNTAQQVFEFLSDDGNRALGTWNAEQLVILQGSEENNAQGGNFTAHKVTNLQLDVNVTANVVENVTPVMVKGDTIQLSINVGGTAHNFKAIKAGELLPVTESFTISGTQYKMAIRANVMDQSIKLTNLGTANVASINATSLKINNQTVTLS